MRMTPMKYLLLGLAFILISSSITLPIAAKTIIENSLRESLQVREITASVHAYGDVRRNIPFEMLFGKAESIHIKSKDVQVGKLLCSRIDVSAHDVDVDMSRLVGDGTFVFEHLGEVTASIDVKEEELAKALEQSAEKLSDVSVTITPSGIEARGKYALGKSSADVTLAGQIIGREDKIFFVSEQVALQHAKIGNFSAQLKTEVELADLSSLPFAVRITNIRPFDGMVYILVEKENISPQ